MSREKRFDKLESDIIDALRRAPGAAPSADLDARILARAHAAVAKPAKRPQPIWFSMAAGLVVLVGSGLALRIWQQVEHAPTALDAPRPAASNQAPAAAAPASSSEDAAAAPIGAAAESRKRDAPARAQADTAVFAPVKPADQLHTAQPGAELRREQALIESKREALNDLTAAPEVADRLLPAPEARPFPAEPAAVIPRQQEAPTAASRAPMPTAERIAPAPAPPAVVAAPAAPPAPATPLPMPAPAPTAGIAQASSSAPMQAAKVGASEGAAIAGRDAAAVDEGELDADGERQRTVVEVAHDEAFSVAVAAVRNAIAAGDVEHARRLAVSLRRDYPQQELPMDVLALVDAPR